MRVGASHRQDRKSVCGRQPSLSAGRGSATPAAARTLLMPRTVTLRREMLGWVGAVHFVLEDIPGAEATGFAVLRCTDAVQLRSGVDVPSPEFLVAPPGILWPGYQVPLDEEFADSLDLVTPDDAALLVIVTQRTPLERSTVNLFAPIVINRHTGLADQFVPAAGEDEVGWRVRTPVPASLTVADGRGDR